MAMGMSAEVVSAFSDESWGGDPQYGNCYQCRFTMFQHSLMNLGVETHQRQRLVEDWNKCFSIL